MFKSVKENDGTYSIRYSEHGLNYQIVKTGVRGCHVNRVINRMLVESLFSPKGSKFDGK